MADKKISQLTAKNTLTGAEELLINDGGTSKKTTFTDLNDSVSIDWDTQITGSNKPHAKADVTADNLYYVSPTTGGVMANSFTVSNDFIASTTSPEITTPDETVCSIANDVHRVAITGYGKEIIDLEDAAVWDNLSTDYTVVGNRTSLTGFSIYAVDPTHREEAYSITWNFTTGIYCVNLGGIPDLGGMVPTISNFKRWITQQSSDITINSASVFTEGSEAYALVSNDFNPYLATDDITLTANSAIYLDLSTVNDTTIPVTLTGVTTTTQHTFYDPMTVVTVNSKTPYAGTNNGVLPFLDWLENEMGMPQDTISSIYYKKPNEVGWLLCHRDYYAAANFTDIQAGTTYLILITDPVHAGKVYTQKVTPRKYILSDNATAPNSFNSVTGIDGNTDISVASGSNEATITVANHGASVGDLVTFSSFVSPEITHINRDYIIKSVPSSLTFIVEFPIADDHGLVSWTANGDIDFKFIANLRVGSFDTDASGYPTNISTLSSNNVLI